MSVGEVSSLQEQLQEILKVFIKDEYVISLVTEKVLEVVKQHLQKLTQDFPKKHGEIHPVYYQKEVDEWFKKRKQLVKP